MNLGADLFDESVIAQVAAREGWNERERERWESLKTSLRIELGVSDLRLWGSVGTPKAVAFTSRLLVRVSEEVRGSSTPILDAISRLDADLQSLARRRVQKAKLGAEQAGHAMTVERDADSDMWVATAQRTPTDEGSGDEPEPISLPRWGTELEAAEKGLEFLRALPDRSEPDAETHY